MHMNEDDSEGAVPFRGVIHGGTWMWRKFLKSWLVQELWSEYVAGVNAKADIFIRGESMLIWYPTF